MLSMLPRAQTAVVDREPALPSDALERLMDPFHRYQGKNFMPPMEEREAMQTANRVMVPLRESPPWLKHDGQCLRFYAYFQEGITESNLENSRVRHVIIYYFLQDGSMMIEEPRIENSGIPQGSFVKRHRIPRPAELGGGYYQYEDLRCGQTVVIYSRAFRLIDCDEFTRRFYEEALGVDFGALEDPPMDAFTTTQQKKLQPSFHNRDMCDDLELRNITLGGSRKNTKLEQYLENDRKVLRFKCYWDDETRYGARTYYVLHFYLADDTMEINECLPGNSGRDPYPVFWKRGPMPKNPHISAAPGMLEPEREMFKPVDLLVGQAITVYNRRMFMYDCDDFTRDFYRKYMGHDQQKIEIPNPPPTHKQLAPPPHNGIGTPEDSLASCLHLVPRAAKKDVNKLMVDSGKVMRFEAVMVNNMPEDENRKFIIMYFLADDTMGVWELPQRNSGHSEGKFAAKGKLTNVATRAYFCPEDLYLGAILEIKAAPFLLTRADEGTLKYMEADGGRFPVSDPAAVLARLPGLKRELAALDSVTPEDLQQIAQDRLGVVLCEHELVTLARAFGEREPAGLIHTAKILERCS